MNNSGIVSSSKKFEQLKIQLILVVVIKIVKKIWRDSKVG